MERERMEGEFKQCEVKIVAQLPWQCCALGSQSPWLLTLPRSPRPLLKTISLPISSCHFHIHHWPPFPYSSSSFFCQVVHLLRACGSHFNGYSRYCVLYNCDSMCVCLWVYFTHIVCYCHQVVLPKWLMHVYILSPTHTQAQTKPLYMKETEVRFLGC